MDLANDFIRRAGQTHLTNRGFASANIQSLEIDRDDRSIRMEIYFYPGKTIKVVSQWDDWNVFQRILAAGLISAIDALIDCGIQKLIEADLHQGRISWSWLPLDPLDDSLPSEE